MSLRARLFLVAACLLAIVTGAAALGSVLVTRANDSRRRHTNMSTAAMTAEDVETAYVAQAASIRLYFISADPSSLDDYNQKRIEAGDASGRLRGLLTATPLDANLDALNDAERVWRNEAILPLITLMQLGQSQRVLEEYRDGDAVAKFEVIADELRGLRSRVAAAAAAADRAEANARAAVARFAVGSVIALIVVLALLSLVTRWWLVRPIRQLSLAVRSSDDHPVPMPRGLAKELRVLAADAEGLRGRLSDELDLATRTREGLTQNAAVLMSVRAQLEASPDNLPSGWSVAAHLVPATGIVAGDCYDAAVIGRDQLSLVVVDVAGHGPSSAVLALRTKELLRAAVRSYDDPSDAVTWVSAQLTDLEDDMFVTAFVARLDFETGLVRFVNAGHPEALVCDSVNVVALPPTGPLIGPFAGMWTTREALIRPGQMLVCYTDGLVEVRDDSGVEFGVDRLHGVLRDAYGRDTDAIVKQCLAEVDAFGSGRAHDDITLAVIARSIGG